MINTSQPIALIDLDDTIFQTRRKMLNELNIEPKHVGALDREYQPRSFMSEKQFNFVSWLLSTAETIPVTARGTEELSRVQVPFTSWAIATHGAVILNKHRQPDEEWKSIVLNRLQYISPLVVQLRDACEQLLSKMQVNGWARINYEYDSQPVYFVMKHTDSTKTEEIYQVADRLIKEQDCSEFYLHRNGNNVAFLPHCIDKGQAVQHLLDRLLADAPDRPVLGLGDSTSDHRFLHLCDWFGMPKNSQLSQFLSSLIT
ncbi:HAD family hydrolase [Limnobaculum xujianqingii]|uniref:HAD family hydrolase n=1 Tax=Limnobaculum xujianqingii TaxID=2738837 RepID=UPI00112A5A28|nr:HAD family hydrolase [Limnobaculum xujianqingii]